MTQDEIDRRTRIAVLLPAAMEAVLAEKGIRLPGRADAEAELHALLDDCLEGIVTDYPQLDEMDDAEVLAWMLADMRPALWSCLDEKKAKG